MHGTLDQQSRHAINISEVPRVEAMTLNTTFSKSRGLFIYLSSSREGMSAWFTSLSEIIVLAKKINATIVEPCIEDGRLVGCRSIAMGKPGARLFQALDKNNFNQYHDKIVSYEDFKNITSVKSVATIDLCMTHFTPAKFCGLIPTMYGAKKIPQIQQAIDLARHRTTVLNIMLYGRNGLVKSKWVDANMAHKVKQKYLRFSPTSFNHVNDLLARMNLSGQQNYTVIHWRAEKPDLDYLDCAQKILKIRDSASANHNYILMSSLNTHSDFMWNGAKHWAQNTSSREALSVLTDHGLLKLDQFVDYSNVSDPGMLAVYDIILAIRANHFITCTKDCPEDSICAACNHRGKFAAMAVSMRRDMASKSSVKCWPQ